MNLNMSSLTKKCSAITKNGTKCTKNTSREDLCTMHYNMKNKNNVEKDEIKDRVELQFLMKKYNIESIEDVKEINTIINFHEINSLEDLIKLDPLLNELKIKNHDQYLKLSRSIRRKRKKLDEDNLDPRYLLYKDKKCPNIGLIKKLCTDDNCIVCFYHSFASSVKSKYWSDKNIDSNLKVLKPKQFMRSSDNEFFFDCPDCNHVITKSLKDVQKGKWCVFCQEMCKDEKCEKCKIKSFASQEYAKYFSKKNIDINGIWINPRNISKSSDKIFLFDCPDCKHEFTHSPQSFLYSGYKYDCVYCAGRKMCEDEKCDFCIQKSFQSTEYSKNWCEELNIDPLTNMKIKPRNIFKYSDTRCYFKCPDCKHTFDTLAYSISYGTGCRYCMKNGQKSLCEDEDCKICFDKSFKSIENSKFLSETKNKDLNAIYICKFSAVIAVFDCPFCDTEYTAPLGRVSRGGWCGCTHNKTELKFYKYLQDNFNYFVDREKKFEWCKNINYMPFDFHILELNLIVEIDGAQHKEQITNWLSPEETQARDKYKMLVAKENNYTVIRLCQNDIWTDKGNWKEKFEKAFHNYEKPSLVFIGDFYDDDHISSVVSINDIPNIIKL
jgi:very-short-patch-repair endonuclease